MTQGEMIMLGLALTFLGICCLISRWLRHEAKQRRAKFDAEMERLDAIGRSNYLASWERDR